MQAKEALNSKAPTGSSRDACLLPDSGIRVTVRPTHLPDPDAKGDGVHLI